MMKVGEYVVYISETNSFYTHNKFYKIFEFQKRPLIYCQYIIDDKNSSIAINLNEKKLNGNWQYVSKKKYRELKLKKLKL